MTRAINIINLRGEIEPFSKEKVYQSARRAGASKRLADQISLKISQQIKDNTLTSQIYQQVKGYLQDQEPHSAIRFSLKEAIRRLGPTGFPFEKLISQIFTNQGWQTQTNQIMAGQCIDDYEIDILAQKNNQTLIGECKFRINPGDRVDLEIALANQARFEDIQIKQKNNDQPKSLIATNTKFTSQVVKYCQCKQTQLLGWRCPQDKGLEYLLESQQLYPITILPSVTKTILEICSNHNLILVKQLLGINPTELQTYGLSPIELKSLLAEAKLLLGSN